MSDKALTLWVGRSLGTESSSKKNYLVKYSEGNCSNFLFVAFFPCIRLGLRLMIEENICSPTCERMWYGTGF